LENNSCKKVLTFDPSLIFTDKWQSLPWWSLSLDFTLWVGSLPCPQILD
jgi:hypothetical protein